MNTNRRGWVKNAIIIFLAIMLILTFFSNTIMNASLPEVAAQYSMSGSITSKIRTSASVTANSKYKITIDESRTVLSVPVREGDAVEIGDVLFYLVDAESNELKTARDTLANLEKQYTLKMLEADNDYYADELAITKKQEELAKARKALGEIDTNEILLDTIDAEIKQLNSDLKALNKQITAYNNQIGKLNSEAADAALDGASTADRIAAASVKYNAAKAAYDSALALRDSTKEALEAAEGAFEAASDAYEALDPDKSTTVDALKKQIADLNKRMSRDKEDYELAIAEIDRLIKEADDAWTDADFSYNAALAAGASQEVIDRRFEALEEARENYERVVATQKPLKESKELAYKRQLEDDKEQLAELEARLKTIEGTESARIALENATDNRDAASKAATDAAEDFTKRESEFKTADTELKSLEKLKLLEECEVIVEGLNAQADAINDSIADKQEEKKELAGEPVDTEAQQEVIKNLTQELATLQHNLSKRREADELQDKRDQLEIDDLVKDIEEQKALVAKYEANSVDAKITATVAGQVSAISAVAGSDTTVGQTLCEIVVTELGYSCEVSLTAEQARRVRVGDQVTISNNWWSDIEASIAAIKNDPKNPGANKIATIALVGDVAVGQNLNLTIGEKGQTYDSVVPNSAVREDNNGKFVLAVEAKSSPLGNRYIAKRIDVEVLASDDTNSAVSGLMGSEFVITTSNTPIAAGTQVRMSNT